MTFNSIEALKNYILSCSQVAITNAQEEVYQIINKFLKKYYGEFSPEIYERTYQLLRSLVKSGVRSTGNGWEAVVYFDVGALDYSIKHFTKWPTAGGYMNPFNGAISPDGSFPNPKGSGAKTMEAAAHGSHGGYVSGTAIWDEPIAILNAEAINILKRELIAAGIPLS